MKKVFVRGNLRKNS